MTFWCRYWSRDRNRDHFGLENGLETGLVTLGSVTFWSQNGLETILVSKKVSRSGLVTQCVRVISIYAHACTPAWAGI